MHKRRVSLILVLLVRRSVGRRDDDRNHLLVRKKMADRVGGQLDLQIKLCPGSLHPILPVACMYPPLLHPSHLFVFGLRRECIL